jgi:A/G-specific adenine glycosylase
MSFANTLITWQRQHGRHHLPWQENRDAYRVWVSEIMLQQTQVSTVIPYYRRFMARFPDVGALACAPPDEVLALWSGLGYYARARNLQRAAQLAMARHGAFPAAFGQLLALPGIGRSTAAAISVFCNGERRAILDGNVRRVLCRHFGIDGWPGEKPVENRLWALAESLLPETGLDSYTQGLMDLGAGPCARRADCARCPLTATCHARQQGSTATLPTPRPRTRLPERTTGFLVLRSTHGTLLEKRPPSGIWGGLWSLPELPPGCDPARACADGYPLVAGSVHVLPGFRHTFTHFRLHGEVIVAELAAPLPPADPDLQRWARHDDLCHLGLPAPIRTLLESLPC